ncbi:(2Fe-2S)-binding protein [Actinomycetospora sp. TBRC 11914]|uniref:(2Fe-2S)-binding protein n=1 Tax=Actinomycetospora sp. TBRC 11914 TaxID=2729387 RepID=UPI00145F2EF0|nr:(2Fe-2S)-binding protein [Actinomycetospora sp. TBRC 11914]NMO89488.1 (2Fe-2S)-binding protein [Actinomycetospora sp. TBRC 11914]
MTTSTTTHTIDLTVNGIPRQVTVEPRTLLADTLRTQLRLTGTHLGCEHGVCGACTVLVDGEPARSCLLFTVSLVGRSVETVESLEEPGGRLNPLQQSFQDHHGLQCGFCTPGILMSLTALLRDEPHPDEGRVRDQVQGHICRCTGYQQLVDAALAVSDEDAEVAP